MTSRSALAPIFVVALASAIALVACGGALAEGKSDFKKGLYGEARETFVAAESDSKTWDDKRRAEYALYRGLTHGALGDKSASLLWLTEAKALEDAHPELLSADDVVRLKLGLESLDSAPK